MSVARLMQMGAAGKTREGWDLANAEFNGGAYGYFNVFGQELGQRGVFFKPDGTKMYLTGTIGDDVNEYDLSIAWDVSSASFLQNFSVSSQETSPAGLFFKPDGTKMYIAGGAGDDVNEYNLSTAWDISTASYLQNFSVSAQDGDPAGIFFRSDGLKLYVIGRTNDNVFEYTLSAGWDISTASFVQSFSISGQETSPYGLVFKDDGTKMYVLGSVADTIFEYSLSTAWDVSTASYSQGAYIRGIAASPAGLYFKADGTRCFVSDGNNYGIVSFSLSSAWDVSTASWDAPTQDYLSVSAQDSEPEGLFLKPDGSAVYIVGDQGNTVEQYSLSTAWDVASGSYVQSFSVGGQDGLPECLFFKPDGTKMYVVGDGNNSVYEYSLSAAWDISTASLSQSFSVGTQEGNPRGVFFRGDGLKMYITGSAGDDVNEYDLSAAWDISTAVYLQNFVVSTEDTFPTSVFFRSDGLKMYVAGGQQVRVNEYDLSTAWDISTASFVQNFLTRQQSQNLRGVYFKPDGKVMYTCNLLGVWAYDL